MATLAPDGSPKGKLVIRNIGTLLSGDLARPILDVLERAADRVVRDVREAAGRIVRPGAVRQVLRRVRRRSAAPRRT